MTFLEGMNNADLLQLNTRNTADLRYCTVCTVLLLTVTGMKGEGKGRPRTGHEEQEEE
jgi:hypothetical protein